MPSHSQLKMKNQQTITQAKTDTLSFRFHMNKLFLNLGVNIG